MPSSRRLRLTIGYRGTRYAGWAVQSPRVTGGRPTVQATLETALTAALDHPVRVTAAGRTDAGVHAEAQVVSLDTSSSMPAEGLTLVLPRYLPDDLWVVNAAEAPAGFDARRSAKRRWYRYAIWRQHSVPSAWQGRCLVEIDHLDVDAMREASRTLLGRRDLRALATQPPARQSTVRTIFAADWQRIRSTPLLLFEICADAFLKQMVRAIVGGLLLVGRGRSTPVDFASGVASKDRRMAGPNAPAMGLTLTRIEYA
jgi:tRNA pseudouridine38-40 synthase